MRDHLKEEKYEKQRVLVNEVVELRRRVESYESDQIKLKSDLRGANEEVDLLSSFLQEATKKPTEEQGEMNETSKEKEVALHKENDEILVQTMDQLDHFLVLVEQHLEDVKAQQRIIAAEETPAVEAMSPKAALSVIRAYTKGITRVASKHEAILDLQALSESALAYARA